MNRERIVTNAQLYIFFVIFLPKLHSIIRIKNPLIPRIPQLIISIKKDQNRKSISIKKKGAFKAPFFRIISQFFTLLNLF
jgi:hypothetical protein